MLALMALTSDKVVVSAAFVTSPTNAVMIVVCGGAEIVADEGLDRTSEEEEERCTVTMPVTRELSLTAVVSTFVG